MTPASDLKSLLDAASRGDSKAVREKLNSGIDINRREDGQVMGNDGMIAYSAMGETCLTQAICGSAPSETIEELLMRGADPTLHSGGELPISAAIKEGNVETVKLLLQHKASINTPTCRGFTPLFSALCKNRSEIFKLLLSLNANYERKNYVCWIASRSKLSMSRFLSVQYCISKGEITFLSDTVRVSPEIREAFQQHLASEKGEDNPLSDTSAAAAALHIVSGSPASDENTKKDTFKV